MWNQPASLNSWPKPSLNHMCLCWSNGCRAYLWDKGESQPAFSWGEKPSNWMETCPAVPKSSEGNEIQFTCSSIRNTGREGIHYHQKCRFDFDVCRRNMHKVFVLWVLFVNSFSLLWFLLFCLFFVSLFFLFSVGNTFLALYISYPAGMKFAGIITLLQGILYARFHTDRKMCPYFIGNYFSHL